MNPYGLLVASIVLVVAALLLGGINTVDGLIAAGQAESVARQATFYEDRYRVQDGSWKIFLIQKTGSA